MRPKRPIRRVLADFRLWAGPRMTQKQLETERKGARRRKTPGLDRLAADYLRQHRLENNFAAQICVRTVLQLQRGCDALAVRVEDRDQKVSAQEARQLLDSQGKLIGETRRLMAMAGSPAERFATVEEARAYVAELCDRFPDLLRFEVRHADGSPAGDAA